MSDYPRIDKLGVKVIDDVQGQHVRSGELTIALGKAGMSHEQFREYFGAQSGVALDDGEAGLYPGNVEAVLGRMAK